MDDDSRVLKILNKIHSFETLKIMKNNLLMLFVFLVSFSNAQEKSTTNETYDLVILNGRVMDPETMFNDVANVGVKDGKIAIITESDY